MKNTNLKVVVSHKCARCKAKITFTVGQLSNQNYSPTLWSWWTSRAGEILRGKGWGGDGVIPGLCPACFQALESEAADAAKAVQGS
jgi:hypothetical protein